MSGSSRRSPPDEGSLGASLSCYCICISQLHVRRRPAGSGACRRDCEQSKECKLLWHLASYPTGTACGDRQPSKRPGVWLRDENWSLWNCGKAAGWLRGVWGGCGGCGGCGAAAGRLRGGCGAAEGRLRGGCGAAAGRLRAGHKNGGNSRKAISGPVGGHSSRLGGARKHKKNCGIRARRFRAKWEDTPANLRVHENHKITAKLIGL